MSQRYLGGIITANPTTPTMTTESGVWTLEQQFQYSNVWSPEIIGQSVRLRSSAGAYFNRTFGTPTNNTKWTVSVWCKKSGIAVGQNILGTSGVGEGVQLRFDVGDTITVTTDTGGSSYASTSNALYRDPSAWYHIVISVDTTQATAANRLTVYVNGTAITWSSFAVCPQNTNTAWNKSGIVGYIGSYDNTPIRPFNGYIAEVYSIDGQTLTASSFGAFDSTGVWQPLAYTGTYGTNGFYVDFSDNSGTTSTTLGKDYSGNGNNWTPNNFSLTAGATYDWMLDSPTNSDNGGTGRGNYCVLNPLDSNSSTLANGNLDITTPGSGYGTTRATFAVSSGKWYWEVTPTTITGGTQIGILGAANVITNYIGAFASGYSYTSSTGNKENNNTTAAYGATYTTNDVIGVALDLDAGTIVFYKNNVSQGTAFTGLSGTFAPAICDNSGSNASAATFNFGQRPFTYTPPTGFKALNTQNLPVTTITNGATVMAATTWTGNGSNSLTVTNGGNNTIGTTFKPDLVWSKLRSGVASNNLYDSVRGTGKVLYSDQTGAEDTNNPYGYLSAFNSNGFSAVAGSTSIAYYNTNGSTYVAWQWQAGQGTTSSNTSGSITSTVSVNATAGFSIVGYTGTGANATVGHGLGVAPSFIIVFNRAGSDHDVYHASLGNNSRLFLDTTAAASSPAGWNATSPTSSVFSLGSGYGDVNTNGTTYVAYCWAAVAGYSAFGSYTGNGSADGPFVFTGMRPRYVMFKCTTLSGAGYNWFCIDTSRNPYNQTAGLSTLAANLSDVESSGWYVDVLSNGFKLRDTATPLGLNSNGATYIYMAFAENPFKIARAR